MVMIHDLSVPKEPRKNRVHASSGIVRDDSDDELGDEDHPWEWIHSTPDEIDSVSLATPVIVPSKRRRQAGTVIVGARFGNFECYVGDIVLLKAEGSHEAWAAIIRDFLHTEDGAMAANFQWFSTEREIRATEKKRKDFYWNELYITNSSDINPLESINGKAIVSSLEVFLKEYPGGRMARTLVDYGKRFICRRGCNTRTTTYTGEFLWEEVYRGHDDIPKLIEMVKSQTDNPGRGRHNRKSVILDSPDRDFSPSKPAGATITPRQAKPKPNTRRKVDDEDLTPSRKRMKIKKVLEFTPLAARRLPLDDPRSTPFQLAKAELHVSSVPTSLPCREGEFLKVYSPLEAAIADGAGTCIYISGTPGTGKTATVREVVCRLEDAVKAGELDDFIFVEINGMKVTEPQQAYSLLWEALRGKRVSPSQALELLERDFNQPSPRRVPCVVLMDELDQLVTKSQSVMYNFFNWPSLPHSRLIVLAVANTMDLPERTLSNKISSRLGLYMNSGTTQGHGGTRLMMAPYSPLGLTRVTFPGYNHEQLTKIIRARLDGIAGNPVEPDAIQFASRKVAAVSGDARRALDICRRAVELAEADHRSAETLTHESSQIVRVAISTIKRAINEATTNPIQQCLRSLPFASKLVLAAMLLRIRRTGLAEVTLGDVGSEMCHLITAGSGSLNARFQAALEVDEASRKASTAKEFELSKSIEPHRAALELADSGIVILEAHRAERRSKMRLAVNDDEIKMALGDDPDVTALGLAF